MCDEVLEEPDDFRSLYSRPEEVAPLRHRVLLNIKLPQELLDKLEIRFNDLAVPMEVDGFRDRIGECELHLLPMAHLSWRSDQQPVWVAPYAQAELLRCGADSGHVVEEIQQLLIGGGDVSIPVSKFYGSVEPAQIEVARSVTKPPPHLHEGVV